MCRTKGQPDITGSWPGGQQSHGKVRLTFFQFTAIVPWNDYYDLLYFSTSIRIRMLESGHLLTEWCIVFALTASSDLLYPGLFLVSQYGDSGFRCRVGSCSRNWTEPIRKGHSVAVERILLDQQNWTHLNRFLAEARTRLLHPFPALNQVLFLSGKALLSIATFPSKAQLNPMPSQVWGLSTNFCLAFISPVLFEAM